MLMHRHALGARVRWWRHRHPVVCWLASLAIVAVAVDGYQRANGAPPPEAPTDHAPQSPAERDTGVPAGWLAIAVPTPLAAPPVRVGDRVTLLGAGPPSGIPSVGRVITRGALVTATADDAITVAVRPDDASDVAEGLVAGVVVLALHGPER
jgi:hypothetical protein